MPHCGRRLHGHRRHGRYHQRVYRGLQRRWKRFSDASNLHRQLHSSPASTGRYTLSNFTSGFVAGSTYAAYPSSGGLLLLEIDNTGIMTGAAYTQTAGATFAASQGYGLNLSGDNLSAASEVDDIAEFAANSTGNTITGLIDENSTSAGPVTFGTALTSGTYVAPVNGRGAIAATAGTSSSNTTLNGGFALTFYTVDGTTFPFIEYGQRPGLRRCVRTAESFGLFAWISAPEHFRRKCDVGPATRCSAEEELNHHPHRNHRARLPSRAHFLFSRASSIVHPRFVTLVTFNK